MGAAISTLASYLLIFGVRAVHTRTMLRIRWDVPRTALSGLLLALECVLMDRGLLLGAGLCFLAVGAINFRPLLQAAKRIR